MTTENIQCDINPADFNTSDDSDNEFIKQEYCEIEDDGSQNNFPPEKRAKFEESNKNASFPLPDKKTDSWNWQDIDNEPKVFDFSVDAGVNSSLLKKLGNNPDVISLYKEILTNEYWIMIANYTNKYAEQVQGNHERRKYDCWKNTSSEELQIYFALSIIMSQMRKSQIRLYWSKRRIISTPIFEETMPIKRFQLITRYLHFRNNEKQSRKGRISQMESVVTYMNSIFQNVYTPHDNIIFHESSFKFRCSLPNRQKRMRLATKFCKICESDSGYCVGFKIYMGSDRILDTTTSQSDNNILELTKHILHKGYTIYLDSLYSSPVLFSKLLSLKTHALGKVRSNRKCMPKELLCRNLKKGEFCRRSCNQLLVVKYKDNKDQYILSTKHINAKTIEKKSVLTRESNGTIEVLPKCIIDYNKQMGDINHQKQMSCFPIMKKFSKGYRKIFFYLQDIALFNIYVLYRKITNRKMDFGDFRLDLAEKILQYVHCQEYSVRSRPSLQETPLRLRAKQWSHFPRHIPPTERKAHPSKPCKVCTKNKKRSETTWECEYCLIPLHVPECFKLYHTKINY